MGRSHKKRGKLLISGTTGLLLIIIAAIVYPITGLLLKILIFTPTQPRYATDSGDLPREGVLVAFESDFGTYKRCGNSLTA